MLVISDISRKNALLDSPLIEIEALKTAFTEKLSGRAPENRGNGLKYVRNVISKYPINLVFKTGDAKVNLRSGSRDLNIETAQQSIRGCLALITY